MKTIPRNCTYCQVEFLADPREVNRGNAKFCSMKCSGAYSSENRTRPEPNTSCAWCKTSIYRKPAQMKKSKSGLFFCSTEHQNLAYASIDIEVTPGPKNITGIKWSKPLYRCSWFLGCSAHTDDYYCARHKQSEIDIYSWLSGNNAISISGKAQDPKHWVKKYIVHERGDACEVCGFNELHPVYNCSIIQMDHIDGNSLNNDPSNLKLLCPNHHTMTTTYGSRNKAGGRFSRRKAQIIAELQHHAGNGGVEP